MKKLLTLLFVTLLPALGMALETTSPEFDPAHKVVIQISSDDNRSQTIALNNAVNLQKHYGIDNVAIEIVAYGPGLPMLTAESPLKERIESLAQQSITFSACGNTMAKIESKTGHKPVLLTGVGVVPAGVVRIIELQEQHYSYIRP